MKKIISLLLIFVIMVGLTACKGAPSKGEQLSESVSSQTEVVEDKAENEVSETSSELPTEFSSALPTENPEASSKGTAEPTAQPTSTPAAEPTTQSTAAPTAAPTAVPTAAPTAAPTAVPKAVPTAVPTAIPTAVPTPEPIVECTEHDYELLGTDVLEEFDLVQYVMYHYHCKICGYFYDLEKNISNPNVDAATIANAEATMISCVNSLRVEAGLNTLWTADGAWDEWANLRAVELVTLYSHTRPNGADFSNMIGNQYTAGENIAEGFASGYAFYDGFLNSPPHKENMLLDYAVGIAVAIHVQPDGLPYCAMVLIAEA